MDKEKNIIFFTGLHLWSLGKDKGGKAFSSTIQGYKEAGWNIWFVSTGGDVPKEYFNKNNLYLKSFHIFDCLFNSEIRLLRIISKILLKYFSLRLENRFFLKSGQSILQNNINKKFVLYAYEVNGVKAAKKLSERYKQPLVTRFQGTKESKTPDTLFYRLKNQPQISALKTSADLTIMTNDGTEGLETLKRFKNNSKNILFWRNGVSQISENELSQREYYREQLGFSSTYNFLTVSRLVNWKHVERAINAFYLVQKKHKNTRLSIIGDGIEMKNLVNLTQQLGLSEKVFFTGSINQLEVSKYMIACDAFLSFYDLSNVGNPLLEAMMCEKPIITLDNGDTGKLIKDKINGILISPNELNKIPEMMNLLIEDKEFSYKISKGAKNTADTEFWSWEERIHSELSVVEKLL